MWIYVNLWFTSVVGMYWFPFILAEVVISSAVGALHWDISRSYPMEAHRRPYWEGNCKHGHFFDGQNLMYRMGYESSGICARAGIITLRIAVPFGVSWWVAGCLAALEVERYRVVGGNLVGSLTHGPKKLSLPSRCCRLHECLRPVVHRQGCGRVEEGSFWRLKASLDAKKQIRSVLEDLVIWCYFRADSANG